MCQAIKQHAETIWCPKRQCVMTEVPVYEGGSMREQCQSEMKVRSATASYTIKASAPPAKCKALPAEAKVAQPPKPLSDKQTDRLTKLLTQLGKAKNDLTQSVVEAGNIEDFPKQIASALALSLGAVGSATADIELALSGAPLTSTFSTILSTGQEACGVTNKQIKVHKDQKQMLEDD